MTNETQSNGHLGAFPTSGGTLFRTFCTTADNCSVRLYGTDGTTLSTTPMTNQGNGFFEVTLPAAKAGTLYKFVLGENDKEFPDPYARFLPQGVHGPALVVAPPASRPTPEAAIAASRPLSEHAIYELHIGTFTQEGTYASAAERLPALVDLGVTAVELMPLSSFAGSRGWGYDGVAHFAPHAAYGTPEELRQFVGRAHQLGLSVILDVVYNHFGPAGNYLSSYSPLYFSSEVKNAWGDAPNFQHPVVRRFVLDNALYWLGEFGFDGLRLDAAHAIVDPSPRHILRELADEVARLEPRRFLIAEDDRNDPALVTELGLDAIWADDFHHEVRVTLTGERDGYYGAYQPGAAAIAETIMNGWLYRGQIYPTRNEPRGTPADALPAHAFVYCIQNHDQIGNRAMGDRLTSIASIDAYSAASTLLLFLPMTPMLFQGQEWASSSPFQFFTDHDPELGKLVSAGRREEFKHFSAFSDPAAREQIPDPQAEETFLRSKLRWEEREQDHHGRVLRLYQRLLELRRTDPVLQHGSRTGMVASAQGNVLLVRRAAGAAVRVLAVNFGHEPVDWTQLPELEGLGVVLRTDEQEGMGPTLPPATAVIFRH